MLILSNQLLYVLAIDSFLADNGKLNVVLLVLAIIFIGLGIYLFSISSGIKKIEKIIESDN